MNSSCVIPNINVKKIDNRFLLTTFYGAWDILSEKEYELYKRNELYERLEKRGMMITDRNIDAIRRKIRSRYNFLCQSPNLHVVGITNRCNYNCSYCHSYSSTEGRDMDEETAKEIADFILSVPSVTLTVEFQGGEPLLNYSVLQYLLEYMEKRKGEKIINYRIVTNLSRMDDDIFKELSDYGVRICTSLDGPKELHNKHRGNGSYENVIYWLEYARENYHRISAIPTITGFSMKYAKEIIDEYLKREIPLLRLRPVACLGRATKNWDKIGISPEQYFEFWKISVRYCIESCINGKWIVEGSTLTILKRLFTDHSDFMCFRSPCGAGINQLAYDVDGNIHICDSARSYDEFIIGSVNLSYNEIMKKTAYLRGICNLTTLCDSCVWSPFCGACIVNNYEHSKSPISIKSRDFQCRVNKLQMEFIIKKINKYDSENAVLIKWLLNSMHEKVYGLKL